MGSAHTKSVRVKDSSATSLITIIDAVTAKGHYFNPGIIFKGKSLQWQWFEEKFAKLVSNWQFTVSDNGWTSNEIAVYWLEEVFLPQLNRLGNNDESRAALLILDGHKSHTTVSYIEFIDFDTLGCRQLTN